MQQQCCNHGQHHAGACPQVSFPCRLGMAEQLKPYYKQYGSQKVAELQYGLACCEIYTISGG